VRSWRAATCIIQNFHQPSPANDLAAAFVPIYGGDGSVARCTPDTFLKFLRQGRQQAQATFDCSRAQHTGSFTGAPDRTLLAELSISSVGCEHQAVLFFHTVFELRAVLNRVPLTNNETRSKTRADSKDLAPSGLSHNSLNSLQRPASLATWWTRTVFVCCRTERRALPSRLPLRRILRRRVAADPTAREQNMAGAWDAGWRRRWRTAWNISYDYGALFLFGASPAVVFARI